MLNHIVIMGRLTRDPELRHTQSSIPVASFTVAVDRDFSGRDGGERQTDFISCVAWRSTGEFVSKYFTKGSMIVVSGRLQIRQYTDKDGNNRTAAEVVADNVYFGESKRSSAGGESRSYSENGGYQNNGYQSNGYQSGNSYNNNYQGGYQGGYSTPVTGSDFAELSDDDGDLPF
jgi:single-strand DNA-binding protein